MSIFRRGGGDQGKGKNGGAQRTKKRREADSDDESESSQDVYKDEEEQKDEKKPVVHYRQWLYDRVDGIRRPSEGQYDKPDPYPPHFLCLPPTILRYCPFLLEENSYCVALGKKGCCAADEAWARNAVMKYSLFLNFMGMLLMVCVSLSMCTSDFTLLQYASLSKAEITPKPESLFEFPVTIYLGMRAAAFENPNTGVQQIVPYDEFCSLVEPPPVDDDTPSNSGVDTIDNNIDFRAIGLFQYLEPPAYENCGECEDAMPIMVIGLLTALVFVIPSMGINFARMYLATDVNCQKGWGMIVSILSLVGCGLAFYFYNYTCKASFLKGDTGISREGVPVEVGSVSEVVQVSFDWEIGYGMICLFAAFGLKFFALICNHVVPTPLITRNVYEQKVYEQKALKARGILLEDHDEDEEVDDYSDE